MTHHGDTGDPVRPVFIGIKCHRLSCADTICQQRQRQRRRPLDITVIIVVPDLPDDRRCQLGLIDHIQGQTFVILEILESDQAIAHVAGDLLTCGHIIKSAIQVSQNTVPGSICSIPFIVIMMIRCHTEDDGVNRLISLRRLFCQLVNTIVQTLDLELRSGLIAGELFIRAPVHGS